jgi:hypothetical protein
VFRHRLQVPLVEEFAPIALVRREVVNDISRTRIRRGSARLAFTPRAGEENHQPQAPPSSAPVQVAMVPIGSE